jgi:hypothetical protein
MERNQYQGRASAGTAGSRRREKKKKVSFCDDVSYQLLNAPNSFRPVTNHILTKDILLIASKHHVED